MTSEKDVSHKNSTNLENVTIDDLRQTKRDKMISISYS